MDVHTYMACTCVRIGIAKYIASWLPGPINRYICSKSIFSSYLDSYVCSVLYIVATYICSKLCMHVFYVKILMDVLFVLIMHHTQDTCMAVLM